MDCQNKTVPVVTDFDLFEKVPPWTREMEGSLEDKIDAVVASINSLPVSGEKILKEIALLCNKELINDDELLQNALLREQSQPSPSCGRIFKNNELIYHCKDCAVDETCVLCSDCFQLKDHEGHNYKYYLSRGMGGSCDCGENESWKIALNCPTHVKPMDVDAKPLDKDTERLISRAKEVFQEIADIMVNLMEEITFLEERDSYYEDNSSVVLFNDEKHTFPQVIEIICAATGKSEEFAEAIAHEIDQQGFASVHDYKGANREHRKTAREMQNIISSIGLRVQLELSSVIHDRLAINGVIGWIRTIIHTCPCLRQPALEALLLSHPNLKCRPFGEFFFLSDREMWKFPRKAWQEILTAGLQFDFVKTTVLDHFISGTQSLLYEKRYDLEGHLSLSHFAVQIFTVPSLAQSAAKRGFVKKLFELLLCQEIVDTKDGKISKKDIDMLFEISQMIRYVANDDSVIEMRLLSNEEHWNIFINSIKAYDMFLPHTRVIGDHIAYEGSDWYNHLSLTLFLITLIRDFAKTFLRKDDILRFVNLLMSSYTLVNEEQVTKYSFQQPMLWLLGSILQQYAVIAGDEFEPLEIEESYMRRVVDNLVFLAEVKSGYWVRNGSTVSTQAEMAMVGAGIYTLYRTVFWHAITSNPGFLKTFMNKTLLMVSGYLDEKTTLSITQTFLQQVLVATLCGSDIGRSPRESLELVLVHALATGPKSFSELARSLVDPDPSELVEEVLVTVANLVDSDSILANAEYRLKSEFVPLFNPNYWHYKNQEREQALEHMKRQFKVKPLSILLNQEYIGSKYYEKLFAETGGIILEQCLRICLLGPAYAKFIDCFVTLATIICQVNDHKILANEKTQQLLIDYVRQSDAECKPQLVALFGKTVKDFQYPLEHENRDVGKNLARELAEERRRKIVEAMKKSQEAFESTNVDALADTNTSNEFEDGEMIESGTCVLCKEPADFYTEEYGLISYTTLIPAREDCAQTEEPVRGEFLSINSCFHLMHDSCFDRMMASTSRNRLPRCPLCNFPAEKLFKVAKKPQLSEGALGFDLKKCSLGIDYEQFLKVCLDHLDEFEGFYSGNWSLSIPYESCELLIAAAQQIYYLGNNCEATESVMRMVNAIKAFIFGACGKDNLMSPRVPSDTNLAYCNSAVATLFVLCRYFTPVDQNTNDPTFLISAMRFIFLRDLGGLLASAMAYDWGLPEAILDNDDILCRFYDCVSFNAKIMSIMCHFWFGSEIHDNLTWLFPSVLPEGDNRANVMRELLFQIRDLELDGIPSDNVSLDWPLPIPQPFKLVDLPENYSDLVLFEGENRKDCLTCGLGKYSIVCLVCSRWSCLNPACSESACPHCVSTQFMVLDVTKCTVHLYSGMGANRRITKTIPAPYVDKHGETDMRFRRGGPLKLSVSRYNSLKEMFWTGGIWAFISRNDADIRIMPDLNIIFDDEEE